MTQQYFDQNLKIFALNSNRPLAEKIAKHVGVDLGKLSVNRFSDGEIQINIEESVRGDNVYVIQSTSAPVNDNLMELLIMVDALRRASAKTINVVMPYYGYARQDRKARSRDHRQCVCEGRPCDLWIQRHVLGANRVKGRRGQEQRLPHRIEL